MLEYDALSIINELEVNMMRVMCTVCVNGVFSVIFNDHVNLCRVSLSKMKSILYIIYILLLL